MEDSEREEHHDSVNGIALKIPESEFVNSLVIPNCSSGVVSDPPVNYSVRGSLNNGGTAKDMPICGDEHSRELSDQSQNHFIVGEENRHFKVVKGEVIIEEILVNQNCISVTTCSSNVSSAIKCTDTKIISMGKEEDITFVKESGNGGQACEQKRKRENECEPHTSNADESDVPQNDFSIETSVFSEKTENNIIGRANKRGPRIAGFKSHVVVGENQDACIFCTQDKSKVKRKTLNTESTDLNWKIKQTSTIQGLSCGISALKQEYTKKSCDDSELENIQRLETDLMQPTSSISGNSDICGDSETKQKSKREIGLESNPTILSRRQKQIEYGKNTLGYQRYKEMVPIGHRTQHDPQTPPKTVRYSRRAWDGLIRSWRRKLHNWDPPKFKGSDDDIFPLVSVSSFPPMSDDSENFMDIPINLAAGKQSWIDEMETDDAANNENSNTH